MANSWNITIIELPNNTVTFRPDLPGAHQGQPLGVNSGDLVTWNNTTNKTLTLVSIPPGTYLTDPIPAGQVSDPIFMVGASVVYSCTNPTQQQHSIVIVPPATS